MRFMIMIQTNPNARPGQMPSQEAFDEMDRVKEEMIDAGILLASEGLQDPSKGARITFDGKGGATVKDGPFTEAKEVIAGFSILQVKDLDEAIAWARRTPLRAGETVEIRQLFELEDFAHMATEEHAQQEYARRDANGLKPMTR